MRIVREVTGSGMRGRGWCAVDFEEQLVGVAPPPVLFRFVGPYEGMVVVLVPVCRRMAVG
ncbi:MAG TPA: hypothetical protein VEJ87_07845 [Acidimicrobiales bacterium]|nr:hypothetical protein [Acidimicrobiales bacterium]